MCLLPKVSYHSGTAGKLPGFARVLAGRLQGGRGRVDNRKESSMKLGALSKGAVVATIAALSLAACSAQNGVVENTTVSVAWNQALYSFNVNTTTGNATANTNVLNLTQQGFNYYDNEFTLQKNTDFGTYEKLSDDPLTVKYTINAGVTWSDGVAVDAADLLLNWVALSGAYNEGEPAYDEETGVLIPGENVYFD